MSDKIAVVYIGDKPMKKDTVTGSRLVFPRHTAVDVESHIAMQLLEFPTVWRKAEELDGVLARQEAIEQAKKEEARRAAEEAERLAAEQSMFVEHLELDLGKLTSVQLATLVEKHELGIKKESSESVDEFRTRVRDALRSQKDAE
ncbi:hypothetical protein ACKC5O_00420 [Aeromonas schubertii]|uniref:hypothetical protein n=1 Tax=Aeromonas schubertii TaxID=652 RepID=UPI0038B46DE6